MKLHFRPLASKDDLGDYCEPDLAFVGTPPAGTRVSAVASNGHRVLIETDGKIWYEVKR